MRRKICQACAWQGKINMWKNCSPASNQPSLAWKQRGLRLTTKGTCPFSGTCLGNSRGARTKFDMFLAKLTPNLSRTNGCGPGRRGTELGRPCRGLVLGVGSERAWRQVPLT